MATVNAITEWTQPKQAGTGAQTYLVPLAKPATAGAKLVLLAGGGATFTAKLGSAAGPAFTKRAEGAGTQSLSVHDIAATGGETQIALTQNGPENAGVVVVDASGLGAFIGASANGAAGANLAAAGDWQAMPAAVTATGPALIIAGFLVEATAAAAPFGALYRWRQMGPLGRLRSQIACQPGAGGQFMMAAGLADVTAAGSYPANLAAGQYQATSMWNHAANKAYAVQALYADASGVATNAAYPNSVAAENSLPGTDSANWFLGGNSLPGTIAAYTDKVSYLPGETAGFKVDSASVAFRVEVYRLGHYGWEAMGARHVLGNQAGYITGTVVAQPAPTVDGVYGASSCAWTTNATWAIPASACPGVYYALVRSTVTPANVTGVHFTVRSPSVAGKPVVVIPDQTYQAYNTWGGPGDKGNFSTGTHTGRSLYRAGVDGATGNAAHRAYAVSFDRPMATPANQQNTYLWDSEYGYMAFGEANGYDLAYLSDMDLDADPQVLVRAKAVLVVGHAEYWTKNTYDAYINAADAGVHTVFASSNIALWRVRFDPADTNRRLLICYKDTLTVDVGPGWAGTGRDPGGYTGTWRDTRTAVAPSNPLRRPENALTGQMFAVNAAAAKQFTVPFAQKGLPLWRNSPAVQALTAGQVYTTPANNFGDEGDLPGQASGSDSEPGNMVNLCPTPVSYAAQGANTNGSIYNLAVSGNAGFTLYRRRSSGALVLHTGGWRGLWGLTRWAGGSLGNGGVTASNVDWQNAFLAIMYDLGVAPATLQAMRPGTDTAPTDPAVGAPAGGRSGVTRAYGLRSPRDGDGNIALFA